MRETVRQGLLLGLLLLLVRPVDVFPSSPSSAGYIRVVQENGTWWFRDGTGRTFFSLGVNCTGGCYGHAEAVPLPPSRKQRIVSLLKEWGFNTAAAWSSPSVWDQLYVADRIYADYTPNVHDVFDEAFWHGTFAAGIRREVEPFLGKTNFIGYFLDNEPEWEAWQIFTFYLSLARETPGSKGFVRYLQKYYKRSIRSLNRAWGTSYARFAHIPQTGAPKRDSMFKQHGLLKGWRTEVASIYYRRYAALVRILDPDHLILGIRYRGIPDRELFTTLAPYFDVNSINDYHRYGALKPVYAEFYRATGKPLMITEFSLSGFPHPGHKSALFVDVYSQDNRGLGYRKSVLQAAQAPFMVGMHWFMWADYPPPEVTSDAYPYPPEANVGLVSHDETVVYETLGRWISRTNAEVEASHRTSTWAPHPRQVPQRLALKRFVPTLDGNIAEWPQALALKPAILTSLVEDVQTDHTYFLAWDTHYLYLAVDIPDAQPKHPHQDLPWSVDYVSIQLSPAHATEALAVDAPMLFLYPIGAGADGLQPYASYWPTPGAYALYWPTPGEMRPLALRVHKRTRPGGYTLEARIPAATVWGWRGRPGASWNITLAYQNVHNIYRTQWQGLVVLRP